MRLVWAFAKAGLLAASFQTAILSLFRWAGVTPVFPEMGLGGLLTHGTGSATFLIGFALHLLGGMFQGLILLALVRGLDVRPIRAGVIVGLVLWFIQGMLIGTFPAFDWLMPSGAPSGGPLGVFAGVPTFYILAGSSLARGALTGLSEVIAQVPQKVRYGSVEAGGGS